MHFVIVAACSVGGGINEGRKQRPREPGATGSAGVSASSADVTDAASADMADTSPSVLVPVAEARAAENGSRLKARWYVGADGSRQFISWQDTELNAECTFTAGTDGILRCTPPITAYENLFFSNAGCTERLVFEPGCAPKSTAIAVVNQLGADPTQCAGQSYQATYYVAAAALQPTQVWKLTSGDCVPGTVSAAGTYRRLGAEVPLPRFVTAQVAIDG